jgi:hypothetical protein
MFSCGHHTAIFIISMFMLLLLENFLTKFIVTCTLKNKLTTWLCLVEGYLASLHDLVSFKIEQMKCSRMRCVTKENAIDRPSLELVQLLPFFKNEAFTTKNMEVTHLGCATMHQFIVGFLLVIQNLFGVLYSEYRPPQPRTFLEVDLVRHIAHGIDRLGPEPSQSPMLVEHRPSHLTQGSVFPFHHTILGRRIRTQKLVFKTQVMAKGFKARVFEFRAIVTADRSYGISVPLIPQPQDKILNKTKCLPSIFQKKTHTYRE